MKEEAIYLYGVIGENVKLEKYIGMDLVNKLYLIENNGLYAVVSKVKLNEFGHPHIEENLENLSWLKEKAELHMILIQNVMEHTQIIPLKFCTIFNDEERINGFLEEHLEGLTKNLTKIKNKEEWSCKIYWEKKDFIDNFMGKEREEIEKKTSKISEGAAYFMKKKLEGNLNEKAVDKANWLVGKITQSLNDMGLDIKKNKILAKEITGRNEEMLMNYALLIDVDDKSTFYEKMKGLQEKVESKGLLLEYTGPWPSYSFVEPLE